MAPSRTASFGLACVAEALFDNIPDIVFFVKDNEGHYQAVNHALVKRCRLADKYALLGKTTRDVFPAQLGERFFAQDLHVVKTGREIVDKLELHLYNDGHEGWCLTNKMAIRDDSGYIVGLTGTSRDLHTDRNNGEGFDDLARVIEHIQSHYDEPLRLDDLARMASMSLYQLDRRIRCIFRITAGQFVVRTRIRAATQMLCSTSLPIVEIAMACGYSDQSAFTRQFKSTTNMTPRQYRRELGLSPAGLSTSKVTASRERGGFSEGALQLVRDSRSLSV